MNKKGFTLIELLAVIVILAIIALISTPLILGVIDKARIGSAESGTLGYLDSFENQMMINLVSGETKISDGTYAIGGTFLSANKISYKGEAPSKGKIVVADNKIASAELCVMGYPIDYSDNKAVYNKDALYCKGETTYEDSVGSYTIYNNGTAVYFDPVAGTKCTAAEAVSTTGTKTGCMKWYTFNDGGSSTDTINLILDHNTTAVVAWNSTGSNVSGPTNVMTQLQTDTSAWAGVPTRTDSYNVSNGTATYTINYSTYKARLIKASEIATITGNSSFVEATAPSTSWFYLDSNNKTQTATTTGASNYDWLFDYTNGCTSYGCNIADASNYGYWTSTAISGGANIAWRMFRVGYLNNGSVGDAGNNGVRPVITISKDVIK